MVSSINFLPPDTMSSTRARLILDEQSFEGLLAAAFTIQEHNDRRRGSSLPPPAPEPAPAPPADLCEQCGTTLPAGDAVCPNCGPDKLRPGERLQRTWASMWMMSQEQNMWPEPNAKNAAPAKANGNSSSPAQASDHDRFSNDPPFATHDAPSDPAPPSNLARSRPDPSPPLSPGLRIHEVPDENSVNSSDHVDLSSRAAALRDFPLDAPAFDFSDEEDQEREWTADTSANTESGTEASVASSELVPAAGTSSLARGFWHLRVKLRFHRADLYLGLAIFVAATALLWPSPATPQRPKLPMWERMLIAIGIAEAPPPAVHLRGDPNIKVWVDTHTALYYCPGDELYGKSPDGHLSSQHDAQTDSFEPAARSACD